MPFFRKLIFLFFLAGTLRPLGAVELTPSQTLEIIKILLSRSSCPSKAVHIGLHTKSQEEGEFWLKTIDGLKPFRIRGHDSRIQWHVNPKASQILDVLIVLPQGNVPKHPEGITIGTKKSHLRQGAGIAVIMEDLRPRIYINENALEKSDTVLDLYIVRLAVKWNE